MRRVLGGLWTLALSGCTAFALANSISVVPRAEDGSGYRVELTLDDASRTPPREAWLAFGTEHGLRRERALLGRVRVDARDLSMVPSVGRNRLPFLRLRASATDQGGLRLFLERGGSGWWLAAEWWDPDLGRLTALGSAPLLADGEPATTIEFEWRAASAPGAVDGSFRASRVELDGSVVALFERTDLRNGLEVVEQVQLGLFEASLHPAQASGRLGLDDFSLARAEVPASPAR